MLRKNLIPWMLTAGLLFPTAACDDDSGDSSGDSADDDDDDSDSDSDSDSDGGQCVQTGSACEINGDCCGWDGGDSSCVDFGGPVVCADYCWDGSDCASGCCILLNSGDGACAPSDECG
ncbi:MAG: hypothetical protein ACRBN8_00985 [Nannocystales bacterium]